MNLRRKKPSDSLYMLLDTMCNAFGGIILLAVMVVLLTNQEKAQKASAAASPAMVRHRLAMAQADLEQSQQLESRLQAKANDPRWKQQMHLLAARKDLQAKIQDSQDVIAEDTKDLDTAKSADPEARVKFLNSQLSDAQVKQLEAQNRLDAAREAINRLKQNLGNIDLQVTAAFNDLERPLRLPVEHSTNKRVVYVLVRYGRLYPCSNADFSQNTTDIKWTSNLDAEIAEPIPGKGLAPSQAGAYFGTLSPDSVYIVFCVFEDSFPAFIQAKELAVDRGISYGWEPRRVAEGPAMFGVNGHIPPAQ